MRKLRLTVELEYDDELMHCGHADPEAEAWFMSILRNSALVLHEKEDIGDDIGVIRVITIEEG